MSAEAEGAQTEAQAAQVELEYHREEKRENKAMDAKLVAPKFNPNLIVRAYVDNFSNGSAKSGAGDRQHPAARMPQPGSRYLSWNLSSPVSTLRWTKIGVSGCRQRTPTLIASLTMTNALLSPSTTSSVIRIPS